MNIVAVIAFSLLSICVLLLGSALVSLARWTNRRLNVLEHHLLELNRSQTSLVEAQQSSMTSMTGLKDSLITLADIVEHISKPR